MVNHACEAVPCSSNNVCSSYFGSGYSCNPNTQRCAVGGVECFATGVPINAGTCEFACTDDSQCVEGLVCVDSGNEIAGPAIKACGFSSTPEQPEEPEQPAGPRTLQSPQTCRSAGDCTNNGYTGYISNESARTCVASECTADADCASYGEYALNAPYKCNANSHTCSIPAYRGECFPPFHNNDAGTCQALCDADSDCGGQGLICLETNAQGNRLCGFPPS